MFDIRCSIFDVRYPAIEYRIKIPCLMRSGEGGGQIRVRCAVPTSFLRECGEPMTRAGDLTCSDDIRILDYRIANSQLRDSAGLAPASPLSLPIRGSRHPGQFSCAIHCMTCKLRCQWTNVTKKPLSRAALENHKCPPEPPTCARSRGNAGGRPGHRGGARHIRGIGTSAGCHPVRGTGWNPALQWP